MKVRNKKTGETVILIDHIFDNYNSLAELNEEWTDYEEPKEYYCIDWTTESGVFRTDHEDEMDDFNKEIGNYFETREEAEKAVEKLKAWKRLKEANIDYKLSREYDDFTETMHANVSFSFNSYPWVGKDLDLLFSREDD